MKKYILLFGAGGMLALASCGGGENKPEDSQQAIDSAVNANMQVKEAQMKAYNDSVINAAAIEKAKADSMLKAAEQTKKGGKTTTKTTKPAPPTTTPTPPPPPPTKGGFGGKSDQSGNTNNGGGFGSKSDQSKTNTEKKSGGGGFGSKSDQTK